MARWTYSLKSGKGLRQAIRDDDELEVLTSLQVCIDEIRINLAAYLEYETELDDIEMAVQDLIQDADYEDIETFDVDYILNDFYNFCDSNRIWVGI